ncbi:hypothetical protein RXV94_07910 [Yeosuana sp. MJ-SS3]|uniref:DUF5723 domain-containing protein n=1 Tax=Gilvirhabdus luticola TaxID=3079858 RepID=A0ABU3U6Q0_9FLAO|nr:hypothetical protein [Yeosuana sp. MJ-SS3]MDU8886081.1 hypothetical protein [Yeosuana sp. MJ-SS3]
MKTKFLLTLIFFINYNITFSQVSDTTFVFQKNGIIKPSILSTHPFGIFFSRLQGNFKTSASKNLALMIGIESGNVWAAPIDVYIPNNQEDRDKAKGIPWHKREFAFNEESLDAKTYELQFDGVIKGFRIKTTLPLAKNQELNIGIRTYILSNGKLPFTALTGDEFIEWFHEKIAGGDDPFGRKLFGLNNAGIIYKDRNENTLELKKGDFVFGGIETSYYFYPENFIGQSNIFQINFGTHMGINLSQYNTSIDFGLSVNAIKNYRINNLSSFNLGVNLGVLRKGLIDLKDNNLDFGNNNFIGNLETIIEYSFISKGKTTHSFGADFYMQTSLNKKNEYDYIIPIRNGVTEKSWFTGVSHLFRNNNYWTLMYSFTRKITTTLYLQQDLTLNNNPDIQTGISIEFGI